MMARTGETLETILAEMRTVFAAMAEDSVPLLAAEIVQARRVALYGVGRNGLALQGFAMRLAHLGLDAHFVGQLAAPPIGPGDLFLAVVALGRLPTADALAATAKAAGARVAMITADPARTLPADLVLHLPARTMADQPSAALPLGSGFELALTLLLDLSVVDLMARLGKTNDDLARRHANLL
jgi:6-phospho-3-hexuloisomerase